MGVATAASSERYILLLIIVAALILTFVPLNFHPDYRFLTTNRQADKVSQSIAIFNQMSSSTFRAYLLTFFRLQV